MVEYVGQFQRAAFGLKQPVGCVYETKGDSVSLLLALPSVSEMLHLPQPLSGFAAFSVRSFQTKMVGVVLR